MKKVTVLPHSTWWAVLFRTEQEKIRRVLGPILEAIHHIGSTSVPGLAAKPIIDILAAVRDIQEIESKTENMSVLGYRVFGEYGLPGRRYFSRDKGSFPVHVHIYESGHPDLHRHLAFRDYLIAHPEEAARYGALKMKLAEQHPFDIKEYQAGKEPLIRQLESAALREFSNILS